MTLKMVYVTYILMYSTIILLFVKGETTKAMDDLTTMAEGHTLSVRNIQNASSAITISMNYSAITSGKNSSISQESAPTMSTPELNISTAIQITKKSMPSTMETHTIQNGSANTTIFTTKVALTTPSFVTESANNYTKGNNNITETNTLLTTQDQLQTNSLTSGVTSGIATTTALTGLNEPNLKSSETVLTSIFSIILSVVILVIFAYFIHKCRKKRSQYSHHPLRENSYESVERYSAPDDTLVISGGLYDAPRIYNPNMTILEEEESQHEILSFSARPGQFRLEFLPGDKEMGPIFDSSTPEPSNSQHRNV